MPRSAGRHRVSAAAQGPLATPRRESIFLHEPSCIQSLIRVLFSKGDADLTDAGKPLATRPVRRDGWTTERRRRFLACLAGGTDVRAACTDVSLSREGAYKLRRRDPAFAGEWDAATRTARAVAHEAFVAMLPERLLRTMSELSGGCELPQAVDERTDAWQKRKAIAARGGGRRWQGASGATRKGPALSSELCAVSRGPCS